MHFFGHNMFPVTFTQVHICQRFKHMDVTLQNIMTKFFQRNILLVFFLHENHAKCVTVGRYGSALDQLGGGGYSTPDLQLY